MVQMTYADAVYKLSKLIALEDGWAGPRSVPPGDIAINNYLQVIEKLPDPYDSQKLWPIPTYDGGISLEWGPDRRSIEFDADGTMFPHDMDESKGTPEESIPFNLDEAVAFIMEE